MDKYFNQEEIEKITSSDKVNSYNRNTLDIRTTELINLFTTKKIPLEQIKNIIKEFPRLLTYQIDSTSNNYSNLEELFHKNTNQMIISNPRVLSKNKQTIQDRINYLINLGLTEKESKKICMKFPTILTLGEINIEISIKNLEEIIKDKKDLLHLIKSNPIILSYSTKMINKKIEWFYERGYNKKQIAKIISKATTILTLDFEKDNNSNIEQKYNYLYKELKFTKEEIISITHTFPIYYTLGLNTIKQRVDNMINLGFSIETIKQIIFKFPQIISLKKTSLNEKYNYYLSKDMLNIFIENPKYLMQSIKLTDARYTYLKEKGLEVNKNNYKKLFVSSKRFKKNYGIDNENILKLYKEKEGYYEQRTNKTNTNKCRRRIKED